MMIGESWALRAILAIPEAIRLAQRSCARSRRDGRRRETALCACVAGFIRNQESRSTGRLQARALVAERHCRRGIGPPRAGAAGDRGIDEAGRDHIAANAFLFTATPVGAPRAIPPQIPFACCPIPRWALRNRPAAVRMSGIRNRWRAAPGSRPSGRCC